MIQTQVLSKTFTIWNGYVLKSRCDFKIGFDKYRDGIEMITNKKGGHSCGSFTMQKTL